MRADYQMPYVLGYQPSSGDLMSMIELLRHIARQSLLDGFPSVSRPHPALLQKFAPKRRYGHDRSAVDKAPNTMAPRGGYAYCRWMNYAGGF